MEKRRRQRRQFCVTRHRNIDTEIHNRLIRGRRTAFDNGLQAEMPRNTIKQSNLIEFNESQGLHKRLVSSF